MGKNKNKGFDFAKRQEKILKKMAQPLYKKPTDSAYLVITEPFGMNPSPAVREIKDINRLSSWISWVFRWPSVMEAVYTMSTRDEVIIKISEGFDVTLMLGKHRYCNILNRGWADPEAATCVFEYDYPANGDPSAHNWREHIALDASAPPGHFRDPYPAPTWTIRPSQLAALARPLPESVPRTPSPSPGPSTATLNPTQQGSGKATVKSPSSAPGSVKVEPSGHPTSSVKSEEPAYQPDQALRDEIARLNSSGLQASVYVKEEQVSEHGHGAQIDSYNYAQSSSGVKQEPRDVRSETPGPAGPSQALLDEWSRLQSQQQQYIGLAASIKPDPNHHQSVAQLPTVPQSQRSTLQTQDGQSSRVKQEPGDVQPETPAAGPSQALLDEWSRLQSQQQQHIGPATSIKPDPDNLQPMAQLPTVPQSQRASSSREHEQRPSFGNVKREPMADEDTQPWKRLRTEFN